MAVTFAIFVAELVVVDGAVVPNAVFALPVHGEAAGGEGDGEQVHGNLNEDRRTSDDAEEVEPRGGESDGANGEDLVVSGLAVVGDWVWVEEVDGETFAFGGVAVEAVVSVIEVHVVADTFADANRDVFGLFDSRCCHVERQEDDETDQEKDERESARCERDSGEARRWDRLSNGERKVHRREGNEVDGDEEDDDGGEDNFVIFHVNADSTDWSEGVVWAANNRSDFVGVAERAVQKPKLPVVGADGQVATEHRGDKAARHPDERLEGAEWDLGSD